MAGLRAALLGATGGCLMAAGGHATPLPGYAVLTGAQIRSTVSGRYVTDDHHWAHHYLGDGRLTRVDKGRVKPGLWAVRGDRLCFTMPELAPQPACYSVEGNGGEVQYLDSRGYVVWQGFIRDRRHTPLFEHVVDPPRPSPAASP